MFTGIVEEVGKFYILSKELNLLRIKISCKKILNGLKIGDSVMTSGVCLTVSDVKKDFFTAEIMRETMEVTKLGKISDGDFVNLERALPLGGRLDGHIVQGHVDSVGKILDIKRGKNLFEIEISLCENISCYVVKKGSIAIDGVSLTVMDVNDNSFKVGIIPKTFEITTLKNFKVSDFVNLETDILGRYVERLLFFKEKDKKIEKTESLEELLKNF